MFERFTDRARRVAVRANEETRTLYHGQMGTEHLLLGLIDLVDSTGVMALNSLEVDLEAVHQSIDEIIGHGAQMITGHIPFTPRGKKVFELSLREALQLGHNYIGTEHILLGLIREGEGVAAQVLAQHGVDLKRARQAVVQATEERKRASRPQPPANPATLPPLIGRDLTQEARAGNLGRVIGRQQEINEVMQVLLTEAATPLLIGEHGAGVTATVHGLAQAVVRTGSPRWFAGKQIVELNLGQLTAPSAERPGPEDRLTELLTHVRDRPGTIWFLDNSLALTCSSASAESVPAITLLRPVLASGELLTIAATTPTDYRQFAQTGDELCAEFQDVWVSELPEHLAIEVLKEMRDRCEARHQVSITSDAVQAAVELSVQHVHGSLLPGKAIDLLDRAAAHAGARRSHAGNPVRELEDSLAAVRRDKREAIDTKDWERAKSFREQESGVVGTLQRKKAELKNLPPAQIPQVTRHDVTAALAIRPEHAGAHSSR